MVIVSRLVVRGRTRYNDRPIDFLDLPEGMAMSLEASAPAKIILFGEHAVVYGQPAIAAPMPAMRTRARIVSTGGGGGVRFQHVDEVLPDAISTDQAQASLALTVDLVYKRLNLPQPDVMIAISSDIPPASGLGSGAAVATAIARVLCQHSGVTLSSGDLNAIIYEVEKAHHGTPSGIDNTVIVYERPIYFVREKPTAWLEVGAPLSLLIADTGVSSSTKSAVSAVRTLYESNRDRVSAWIADIGAIAQSARDAIAAGDLLQIGQLMRRNHARLRDLTVSSAELDKLVAVAEDAGAYGAKLSGGGRGGHLIVLVNPKDAERIAATLVTAGSPRVYAAQIGTG